MPAAAAPPRFALLVFDWDGTLMDSIATIVECTREALARIEGLAVPPEATVRAAIGMGLRETIEAFAPGVTEEQVLAIAQAYRDLWVATYHDRPVLFTGVRETLERLRAEGYLLAVATAKSRRGLERELAATGLGELFDATRTVDEAPAKPHPGMVLGLLEELAVGAEATLVIGDTTYDLAMASAAGAFALGVTSGSHPRELLEPWGPLACLGGVAELPEYLAARAPARENVPLPLAHQLPETRR